MRRNGLVLLICTVIACTTQVLAQGKHPLIISLSVPPGDVTVTRDTVLEFQSVLPEGEPKNHYVVCCRDQVRDFGDFIGKVTLHWDPAKELGDYFPLTVWKGNPRAQGIQILRFRVHIAENVPAVFVPLSSSGNLVGNVELRVQPGKQGETLPPVDLYLDGKPLGLTTDASGKAVWNAATAAPGVHKVQGMARLSNGSSFTMEPLPVQVVSPLRVSLYAPGGQLDLAKVNGAIPIRAFLLPDLRVKTVTYLLDGAPVGLRSTIPLDQLAWNPNGIAPGKHRLKLKITDADSKVIESPETVFTVVPRPRSDGLFITELPRQAGIVVPPAADEVSQAVHLVMPQTSELLLPWTLRVEGSGGQKLRRVTFYRDGQALPADPESSLALLWDPRGEQPGDYSFRAEVVGEDGKTLKTPAVTIHVPVRVALGTILTPVTVTEKAHSVVLKARLVSGLQPKQVDFLVDGKVTASRIAAPFDQMEFDTADVETGPHRLQLQVTDTQGAMYTSQWVPFTVDNAPLIARHKRQAEADKRSADEARKAQRTNELADLRRSLTAGAFSRSSRRVGQTGRIHGLTVVQKTLTDRLTGITTIVSETGNITVITATVSPGSGQVTLLAQAAQDTQASLQAAAEYCKRKVGQMGQTVNWSMIDMQVQSSSTLPVAGPSAGAAYAVTLLSSALKMPIDSSVALTGAIGPNGEIQAVGGVIFKGEAALADPYIHTLIVPADWVSQAELDALYKIDPALFTNKRIIYAHNMEELLRQSVIGYDKRYDQAEAYIQDALRAFLNEEYEKSLLDLTAARGLTPENVTILAWIDVVKAMKNNQ